MTNSRKPFNEATQFLAEGITKYEQAGVFVTFEESVDALRRNSVSLGLNVEAWEKAGKWTFIDASPQVFADIEVVGNFDLEGLLIRIKEAVTRTKDARLCMDSIGSLF